MRKYIVFYCLMVYSVLFAQNPEIKPDLPTVIPPSPTVSALMKFEEVPVSNYTGLPDVSVPIFSSPTLAKGVDVNIALKYHAAGTKVKENASDVGLGWSLFAGGTISRTVRGMPDEVLGDGKIGVYNTNSQTNNNYYKALENYNTVINSTNPNLSLEDYREFMFNVDAKGLYDTQHDLWQFNFLNQSGRFIVVKNNNNQLEVQMLENSTLKIYPLVDSQYQFKIIGFNVFDDLGNNYKFDISESTISSSLTDITHHDNTESSSLTSYTFLSAFHLSKVYSPNNQLVLELNYLSASLEHVNFSSSTFSAPAVFGVSINDEINAILNSCAESLLNRNTFYIPKIETSIGSLKCQARKIDVIDIKNVGSIKFEYYTGREDDRFTDKQNSKVLDKIIVKNVNNEIIRNFVLERTYIDAPTKKMFLSKVKEVKNGQTENHFSFTYKEPVYVTGNPGLIKEDAWGYLKEDDVNFPNKEVDITNVDAFVLERMNVLTGGTAFFDYEPNSFSHVGAIEVENFENNLNNYNVNYNSNSITSFNVSQSAFIIDNVVNKISIDCNINSNTFDWFLEIYHNGQLYRTISNDLCVNGVCKAIISNLPIGSYTVKLKTVTLGAVINSGYPFNINYVIKSLKSSNEQENHNYGGGFRIKKISYYNYLGANQSPSSVQATKSINYNYNFFNQNQSSGSLNSSMPLFEYSALKIRPEIRQGCQGGHVQVFSRNDITYNLYLDKDIINKNLTKGSEVGYKNIMVFETGNGSSKYTYTSSMDYEDTVIGTPPLLNFTPINFDYKRGLLLKEEKFNNDNKLLTSVDYNYTFEDSVVVTGLNVFGTFYSTYNSNPVYKMFTDYSQYIIFKGQNYCYPNGPLANFCSVDTHVNTFKNQLDITHLPVQEAFGWVKLTSKTSKNYFYPNGGSTASIVESNETFTYNSLNKQIASHTVDNSIGETLTTNYFYHTGNSPYTQNRIAEIERIETKRGSELLSESKINYSNTFANNASYLPQSIEVKKGSSASEIRLKNNVYDEFGHVLEVQQESGMKISYIYGYNKSQPVAKIENIAYSAIPSSLISAIQNATDEQTLLTALTALRNDNALANAMVTTITYKPLIGVSTMTDPKGDKITYHYDSFNRLEFVKDKDGNILSENAYHYKDLAQSSDLNWVKSKTYKVATTTAIATPTPAQAITQVSYFDGLGRSIQQIAHAQSNSGKDIVTHITYDELGRQTKEFLPYANQTASLNYNANAATDVLNFYNTTVYENTQNPFSEKLLEASPLNRVLKQAAPGEAWKLTSGHEIKFDYQTNETNDYLKLYKAIATWNATSGLYDIAFVDANSYANNQLYKTITKDENWKTTDINKNTTQEFKDKEGKVILKRTFNNADILDTYYIYDQFGNLTYVVPPAVSGTVDQTKLDNMCYQYKYDYRNRLVEKKLPGKQWEYIVYDKLDRVVATGPAYNPYGAASETEKGWMLTKYDEFNRPVYSAWYNAAVSSTANRKTLQDSYNNATAYSESKTSSDNTINGIITRYTNNITPSTFVVLTVNYYDNYEYTNAPSVPSSLPDSTLPIVDKVKGMPTGSWVRILDTASSTTNELSYTFYDTKYRPVRSYTKNYLGGYTQVDTKLDWVGKTEYTITKHKRLSNSTELVTKDSFTYSAQDRLEKHLHKINALAEQLLTNNTYDELGQVNSKNVGGADVSGDTGLQKVDYSYNIRGWLKSINDISNLAPSQTENDLFAYKLCYNNPETATSRYNGNISETFWRTDSDNVKRKYTYKYDDLNRLLEANYSKPGSSSTTDNYLEQLTYDKNGNIISLVRNGDNDNDGNSVEQRIDDLVYTYDTNNKNLLKSVTDITTNPQGFKDGNALNNDFSYDANGNMILDKNKGITAIAYNHLNLPVKITFGTNGTIEYIYNSVGQKLQKVVDESATAPVTTDYLSGFQYKDAVLTLFPHAEGYVNVTLGKKGALSFNYVFNYMDHLGNVRLSYADDIYNLPSPGEPRNLVILEENHYYPFGLKHTNYNNDEYAFVEEESENIILTPVNPLYGNIYNYKYNGKELQEELGLNMYDYGARNYDPSLGRWMNIDPLAELGRRWSPYNYTMDNPIYFIDPDGMLSKSFEDKIMSSASGTTWANNDNGTFSASNGDTIDAEGKEKSRNTVIESKTDNGARVKRKGTGENINYLDPNDEEHRGIYVTAERQIVEDGILKIFTHGYEEGTLGYRTVEDIEAVLYRDSEVWRNFVDNGGKLTVILYSCLTAKEFADGSKISIAKKFAVYNFEKGRDLELIAPTSNIAGENRKRFIVLNGGHWVKFVKKVVDNITTKKQ